MIANIDVNKLEEHPDNPRKDLGDLTELSQSIKANGIFQNLTVVPWFSGITRQPAEGSEMDGYYRVVIGHRRLAAAKLAGLTEVPCVIADMDMKTQVSTMLLENMQRQELTVYEQAEGFQMLLSLGETISDISEKTGFSESTIRRRTKLAELENDKFKEAVERGGTLMDFAELEKISDIKTKNSLLEKIGTSNFRYSLQSALDAETRAKSVAALLELLDSFAERVEISDGLQSIRYITKTSNIEFEKPDDTEDRKYYYIESSYHVQLLVKKEQVDTSVQNQATEAAEKLNTIRAQLCEISKRAFQLRADFVKYYSAAKAKKNIHMIIEFSICNTIKSDYNNFDEEMLLEMLSIELGENEEFSFNTISQQFASYPEKLLFLITYCTDADSSRWSYYNWQGKYENNPSLDTIYGFLTKLGYEMSDDEKALADGTHELFIKKRAG